MKQDHRLTIDSLFNFGRARADVFDPTTNYNTVAKQWFFNSLYEYYFTEMDAVWSSLGLRWDPLAGFDMQLLANAGYLYANAFQDNRVYFTIALLSQLSDKLSLEARFLLLYDSRPAGLYKTDTTTVFSLVYSPFKSEKE